MLLTDVVISAPKSRFVALSYPVVLASASPRRHDLLGRIVETFEVVVSEVDEWPFVNPIPWETARRTAQAKAKAVFETRADAVVIGCDTIVALPVRGGYEHLFKPESAIEAKQMLSKLSGVEHLVITGVCVLWPKGERHVEVTTGVRFRKITPAEIDAYVASGEPFDKAGGYAAQGKGAGFIEGIRGSLTNVIGLPVDELRELLERVG